MFLRIEKGSAVPISRQITNQIATLYYDLLTDEEANALAMSLPLEAAVILQRNVSDDDEPRISSTFA